MLLLFGFFFFLASRMTRDLGWKRGGLWVVDIGARRDGDVRKALLSRIARAKVMRPKDLIVTTSTVGRYDPSNQLLFVCRSAMNCLLLKYFVLLGFLRELS